LIHGHTSRIEEYDGIVPALARRRRVIVPDLPGSGYSDKPDRRYTLEFLEDALLGLLDALGVKACDVGGGSLGGNLTLRLAMRAPERFVKLAPWAPAGGWEPLAPWLAALGRFFQRPLLYRLLFWPSLRVQSRYWYEPAWPGRTKALAESFAYSEEVYSPEFARMYWEIGHDQLCQSLLGGAPSVRQPTLLLWGDRDHGLDMGTCVRRLAELLPRARLHVFPGARHALAQEVPDELARVVDEFLVEEEIESSLRRPGLP
jgi:pimeloyl-ACP methyl ester carboxylesterase